MPLNIRVILGVLRLIAILALALALANPIISYTRQFERQKRVTLLVDASGSMDKPERGKSRLKRLDSLLSSGDFDRLEKSCDVNVFSINLHLGDI